MTERRVGSHEFLSFEILKSFDSRCADDTLLIEKVELPLVFGVFGCSVLCDICTLKVDLNIVFPSLVEHTNIIGKTRLCY